MTTMTTTTIVQEMHTSKMIDRNTPAPKHSHAFPPPAPSHLDHVEERVDVERGVLELGVEQGEVQRVLGLPVPHLVQALFPRRQVRL